MEELRFFNTETDFKNVENELEYPTVSWVKQAKKTQWMEKPDYVHQYLTFVALESGTFTFKSSTYLSSSEMSSISYSLDDGETWTTTTPNSGFNVTTPTVNKGDKVMWKGSGSRVSYAYKGTSGGQVSYIYFGSSFSSTCKFKVEGNLGTLLRGNNFNNMNTIIGSYTFYELFKNNNNLIDAKNLILPASSLSPNCYSSMFYNCKSLELPPELPATTLATNCYNGMFFDCKSLKRAPELPATTLVENCYRYMFYGCTLLTTAPELPATTLVTNCYERMFYSCSSLNYIKAMFTTTPSASTTSDWVYGVSENGTFVMNSTAEWDVTGDNGIPSGWTVKTANE